MLQYLLHAGVRLCCLGDEPYNPLCRQYAQNADWLMHETFCTCADRERFKPYEKRRKYRPYSRFSGYA